MTDHARPYGDGTYGTSGVDTSTDLATDKHVEQADQQSTVLALAAEAGWHGITGHDVQAATGWGDSPKSRAMSNLLRDGKLVRLIDRRDHGYVHVLPDWVLGRITEPYRSIAEKHRQAGYLDGERAGTILGLHNAFAAVDGADNIGDALITLRQMIEEAGGGGD